MPPLFSRYERQETGTVRNSLYFGDMTPPDQKDGREHAVVGTAHGVRIDVRPFSHHLTPEGAACVETSYRGRAIGRCLVPEERLEEFLGMDLFDSPVSLALDVREGGPGLAASVLALVPMSNEELSQRPEPFEPWRQSSPGARFDAEYSSQSPKQLMGVFLGEVVRFQSDRAHPGSLLKDAGHMLKTILQTEVGSVVDRLLDELGDTERGLADPGLADSPAEGTD
ncbi:MAG: hypothetical protein J4G03_01030 [Gemmatimonadetes bacterium]|nr:hypothetical protein [Gemmatimonadota bacterium]